MCVFLQQPDLNLLNKTLTLASAEVGDKGLFTAHMLDDMIAASEVDRRMGVKRCSAHILRLARDHNLLMSLSNCNEALTILLDQKTA